MSLEEAIRARRIFKDEIEAERTAPQRLQAERCERERMATNEALEYFRRLPSDLWVLTETDEMCQDIPALSGGDRFTNEAGEVFRAVEEHRCWVLGDDIDAPNDPKHPLWLLVDHDGEGLLGKFVTREQLTRVDPRKEPHKGREFVTDSSLRLGLDWEMKAEYFAAVIVDYERSERRR